MDKKPEVKKEELTKEELTILINVLNAPRQQDLQTAQRLIALSNKLSAMVGSKN
jgi:hypothetical protein